VFTAWGYGVTYLELISVLTSLVAVFLGALGARITWPWWLLSSALYAIFFFNVDLYASAILQFVFIAAAIWGWRGWKSTGAEPRYRAICLHEKDCSGSAHFSVHGLSALLRSQKSALLLRGPILFSWFQALWHRSSWCYREMKHGFSGSSLMHLERITMQTKVIGLLLCSMASLLSLQLSDCSVGWR